MLCKIFKCNYLPPLFLYIVFQKQQTVQHEMHKNGTEDKPREGDKNKAIKEKM